MGNLSTVDLVDVASPLTCALDASNKTRTSKTHNFQL